MRLIRFPFRTSLLLLALAAFHLNACGSIARNTTQVTVLPSSTPTTGSLASPAPPTLESTSTPVPSAPVQANGNSEGAALSGDGRYVAFASAADNLVRSDTNDTWDIFVRDLQGNTTTLVSMNTNGAQAEGASFSPSISADGRYVAFHSRADNLVNGDSNNNQDIFVHDLQTRTTICISLDSNAMPANGYSEYPVISADGRYVAFGSDASNLVNGDMNDQRDVFVHDLQAGTTSIISVAADNTPAIGQSQQPVISTDGRYVAFLSLADNLLNGDANDTWDVFLRDLQTGTITLASAGSNGAKTEEYPGFLSISGDGHNVAFVSVAGEGLASADTSDTSDIFVHDLRSDVTIPVSIDMTGKPAISYSSSPAISADGRFVAFISLADNLVSGDTNSTWDIFVRDLQTSSITRVSLGLKNTQANDGSFGPSISADGRYVAFLSLADNLVNGDTNGMSDIFMHDLKTNTTILVSTAWQGQSR